MTFSADHFSKYIVTDKDPSVTPGDVNIDGKADNLDAALVLQYDADLISGL